ncbi:MAG: DUF4113 domain-containing protein [Acidobacteriota bacterium]|nr:DUF4113 domain-containing protein [Acidobacteriota bacterium]
MGSITSVTTLDEMKEAVALYMTRAAERLRNERLAASVVTVFIETSRFEPEGERYANSATHELLYPTDSTEELLSVALRATESLFRTGYRYKKAGVMLNVMKPSDHLTGRMFHQDSWERSRRVSQAMDDINRRHGRHTIRYGSVETEGRWQMKAAHKSQRYTTNMSELLIVDVDKPINC